MKFRFKVRYKFRVQVDATTFLQNGEPLASSPWQVVADGIQYTDGDVQIGSQEVPTNVHLRGELRFSTGVPISEFSDDETLAAARATAVPTERAIRAYLDNLLIGSVAPFAMEEVPVGWLECNGQAIDRLGIYAPLFERNWHTLWCWQWCHYL